VNRWKITAVREVWRVRSSNRSVDIIVVEMRARRQRTANN
jgi:hypothetical protein